MIQLKCQCGAKFSEHFVLKHKFEGMDSADKKLFDKLYILSIIITPFLREPRIDHVFSKYFATIFIENIINHIEFLLIF